MIKSIYSTALLVCLLSMPVQADDNSRVAKLRHVVQQVYPHGVPKEVAKELGPVDALVLQQWLKAKPMAPYHSNMLQLLGVIGNDQTRLELIAYIERGEGPIDMHAFSAKLDAIMALGQLVREHDDQQAREYLLVSIDIETWRNRPLSWQVTSFTEAGLYAQLARQASLALAQVGN